MGVGSSSITSPAPGGEFRALLDELVRRETHRLRDVPGTPKTSLPNSMARRAVMSDPLTVHLPPPPRRGHAGNDAISHGEIFRSGVRAQRKFTNNRAPLQHFLV